MQTHIGLKGILKEIDEDKDEKVSLREFILIFRKVKKGEFANLKGFQEMVQSINVAEVGVGGAKNFFEQKMKEASKGLEFEKEIKAEQESKKKEREEAAARKAAFKARQAMFK